jgi:hypothetical protein
MNKAPTLLLVGAALLSGAWLLACGNSNTALPGPKDASTSDSPAGHPDGGGQDAPSGNDGGGDAAGDGGASCGTDEAGVALSPFTCCVMGLIDQHTNNTDTPDPGFCNNLQDNESDPGQFAKYF